MTIEYDKNYAEAVQRVNDKMARSEEKYRDNPLDQVTAEPKNYRRAWSMVDMILKPEKCKKHDEWMKPYTTFDKDYVHQTIERVCESCVAEKTKTH